MGDRRNDRAADRERWRPRVAAARVIRLVVLLAPIAVCVAASFVVTRQVPAPAGALSRLGWLLAVVAFCGVLAWPARRWLRRLLPLAALLELSLLFPGEAPSRWRVAREAGAIRHLQLLADGVPHTEPTRAAATILALVASLSRHDRITRGHSERVRILTDMVSEEMGLPRADRDRLRWAALIHDVGKLDVPAKLLRKPGRPTQAEWTMLRLHPEVGARLVAPLAGWLGEYAAVVLQHHERYDGTGYPAGLRGDEISLGARIVALTDAFEVMTAARPYKKATPRAAALRELVRCSGTHFDPAVVRAMLAVSTPRLRRALGPASVIGQLPVIATAPAGGLTSVAGTVARGAGVAVLGGVAGAVVAGTTAPPPAANRPPLHSAEPQVGPVTAAPSTATPPSGSREIVAGTATGAPAVTGAPAAASASSAVSPATTQPAAPAQPAPSGAPTTPTSSTAPTQAGTAAPAPSTTTSPTSVLGGAVGSVTDGLSSTVGNLTTTIGNTIDGVSALLGGSTQATGSPTPTPAPSPTQTSGGGLLGGLTGLLGG